MTTGEDQRLTTGPTLVGTWKLVSAMAKTAKGKVIENPYGLNPTGFITYTDNGRMMAILAYGGRKALSVNDRVSAPTEERAAAFATMLAYAGRYTVADETVTHHVEVASFQNWVDTDLVRVMKLEGNRLTLRTPAGQSIGGTQMASSELVWERMS